MPQRLCVWFRRRPHSRSIGSWAAGATGLWRFDGENAISYGLHLVALLRASRAEIRVVQKLRHTSRIGEWRRIAT